MMQEKTKKLYDLDSYATAFSATVLSCEVSGKGYAVVLDETLFFPEEGGQAADGGKLGGAEVLDVRLEGETVVHLTDRPFSVGMRVDGEIEWAPRFRKMQHHTGEHLVSGIANRLYGVQNVGFHLGDSDVTVDFDRPLSREELDRVEDLANAAIAENVAVFCEYPGRERLETLSYRAKLDLRENVRIVTIEGYDACACCAPHVRRTGEIGLLKILDAVHYKGGTRLWMLCGLDAVRDYRLRYGQIVRISNLLSAKQAEVAEAVEKVQNDLLREKQAKNELKRVLLGYEIETMRETKEGNILVFSALRDAPMLRELVNAGVKRCRGICGAFSGDDASGYQYVIGAECTDLRALSVELNRALSGRGGGSVRMIQGSVQATAEEIRAFFARR